MTRVNPTAAAGRAAGSAPGRRQPGLARWGCRLLVAGERAGAPV